MYAHSRKCIQLKQQPVGCESLGAEGMDLQTYLKLNDLSSKSLIIN